MASLPSKHRVNRLKEDEQGGRLLNSSRGNYTSSLRCTEMTQGLCQTKPLDTAPHPCSRRGQAKSRFVYLCSGYNVRNSGRSPRVYSRVQTVNTSLDLSAGGPQLEPYRSGLDLVHKFLRRPYTNVLERVLYTGVEVRQKGFDRSLVLHISRDTLCDFNGG